MSIIVSYYKSLNFIRLTSYSVTQSPLATLTIIFLVPIIDQSRFVLHILVPAVFLRMCIS